MKKDKINKDRKENKDKVKEKNKEKKKIRGFTVDRICFYFLIYSILGFIVESLFGVVTKGVLESRKSFLYGPFCGIYGVGAVIMILVLYKFRKNSNTVFWGGFILGSIIEYTLSVLGEWIFNIRWWDYYDKPLNINGRICAYYSIFWGLLAIYLITYFNPRIDRLYHFLKVKIGNKIMKIALIVSMIFIVLDCIATAMALELFYLRSIALNDLNVGDKTVIQESYDNIYNNEKISDFIYRFWGDEKMLKSFPNLRIVDNDGKIIYMDSLYPGIKTYYFKVK